MPNRLIKESICTSEDIAQLSKDAEILFYRLIVSADDYGRYFGNPHIVKSNCFPLKSDFIRSDEVDGWLDELAAAGLIYRYEAADGRKYICFRKWDKHQTVRAKKSKFPEPESICKQMQADASKCLRNPIQSNPIRIQSESNPNDDDDDFDSFWDAYPKKSGDIRQAYFEYLGAIQSGASEEEILEAVKKQSEVKDARFFPSAEKWLRNRGWTEQLESAAPKKKRVTTFMDIGEAERERRSSDD